MSTKHPRQPGRPHSNDEAHQLWDHLKRGQIQQLLLALIPSKRATAKAAALEYPSTAAGAQSPINRRSLTRWRLRHQVIMQQSAVSKLRDAIDQFLAVSVSIEEA